LHNGIRIPSASLRLAERALVSHNRERDAACPLDHPLPHESMTFRNAATVTRDPYADYWDSIPSNEQLYEEQVENPPRRGRARNYSGEGVTNIRMSQTEVALRLARHIATSPLFTSLVIVKLGGAEVNRRGNDTIFPVARYLSRWGFSKDHPEVEVNPHWIGFYTHKSHPVKLALKFDKFEPHVWAPFATRARLVVHCSAGNVTETRSPAEVHDLNRAIGRAVGWGGTKPNDIIAVCVPRSERFRKLTAEKAKTVGVQRAGLRFLLVDRGGQVTGLDKESLGA
jgi:hypothetical protein